MFPSNRQGLRSLHLLNIGQLGTLIFSTVHAFSSVSTKGERIIKIKLLDSYTYMCDRGRGRQL